MQQYTAKYFMETNQQLSDIITELRKLKKANETMPPHPNLLPLAARE